MLFEFGQYKVDVDVKRTSSFYNTASHVSNGCSCDGCQNFEKAVDVLPQVIIDLFSELGIDMKKVCECYVNRKSEDGTLFYGGFYHLCGTLVAGQSAWISTDAATSHFDEDDTFSVTSEFHISFEEDVDLLEKDFPTPVLQLEFLANIPWVLDKPNTYL